MEVFLIPTVLHEEESALQALPAYLPEAVKKCDVFFVENEKTARRFFKKLWREMVIDAYEWYPVHKMEQEAESIFATKLKEGKTIGIVSEAGCPGIADPGQILVRKAQEMGAVIRPLIGPNSMILALMASGMNGQCFQFSGYLPVDSTERKKKIKELEVESGKKQCTQIFIETPYRNNQLIKDVLQTCKNNTRFCIAADLTASSEYIKTKTIGNWKKEQIDLHKRPAIFLLQAEG